MGACNAANYVSKQPERNRIVNTRFVTDTRYISYRRLLCGGDLFGMHFIFTTIPEELVPFDYATFYASGVRLVTVVTDCLTGEPLYYEKKDLGEEYLKVLRASSSLPFIAKPVEFRGRILMDGGLSDSVPIRRCMGDGVRKPVVVLTREKGYRKSPSRAAALARLFYPRYPGLKAALASRYREYNETMDFLDAMEERGELFVIRPRMKLDVGRVERNRTKIYRAYEEGCDEAAGRFSALEAYLGSG
jgi:predicted patatin/cPLA2 family phospholipase